MFFPGYPETLSVLDYTVAYGFSFSISDTNSEGSIILSAEHLAITDGPDSAKDLVYSLSVPELGMIISNKAIFRWIHNAIRL